MKKSVKTIGVLSVVVLVLMVLTGCGSSNTLVATREIEGYGSRIQETMEINFRSNEVNAATITYEFDDEEEAESYYSIIKLFMPEITVTREATVVTLELDGEGFGEHFELDIKDREEIIRILEDEGYTIR